MQDEQKLLQNLLSGHKKAAREVYLRFMPRLLNFIRWRVDNEKDVEEIAQDTMFAFLESARDFTGKSRINTYICAIANNKVVDYYRKKRLKKILFSQMPKGFENLLSELGKTEGDFDNQLLGEKINLVFQKLSPLYAKILKLKYIEGRSVIEIAETLSMSFKASESMLFRARKAFVKIYETGR